MPLIFQYGSNTDTTEINSQKRLAGRAVDLGRAQTVEGYQINFNKQSINRGCATADLQKKGNDRAWGVLYEISDCDLVKLAQDIEGPSYECRNIEVEDASGAVRVATTFVVREDRRRVGLWTSFDYVGYIVNGLRTHGVEEVDPEYIQHVIDVALDTNRNARDTRNAEEENRKIESLRIPS